MPASMVMRIHPYGAGVQGRGRDGGGEAAIGRVVEGAEVGTDDLSGQGAHRANGWLSDHICHSTPPRGRKLPGCKSSQPPKRCASCGLLQINGAC